MFKNNKKRFIAIGSAITIALTGFASIQAAEAATGKNCNLRSTVKNAACDSVTYGALHRISTLDKLNPVGGYTESQMAYIVQGQLFRFNADGVPSPDLVTAEKTSDDGLTVTHTLRAIKYSDGTPLVAGDAVNQFNRWVASKQSASYIAKVDKVVAPDDRTLVWTLKSPYVDFRFALAQEFMGIHPASRTNTPEKAKEYFKAPVSAGPMMVKTFTPGTDLFVVVANPNYWAVPVTKELRVVTIPDANTRLAAFQAGTIDYVMELPLSASAVKWDKTRYRVAAAKDSGTFMIAFNMGVGQPNKALKDARVRQAISLAVNRADIMRVAFSNLSKPNCGMQFNTNNKYYICSLPKNGIRDVAAARKLLKEAGYADGFKLYLHVPNRVLWQDAASIIKANLALLKIDVTIDMVTPDTNISAVLNKREWEAMWFGNNAATPILQLSNWFVPGGVWANNANVPSASLVETAKLLDEAGASTNFGVIRDKLVAVEKIAYDLSAFIPIGTRFYLSGSNIGPGLVQALMPGQLEFVIATNPPLPNF